jgi:hypothetical protein
MPPTMPRKVIFILQAPEPARRSAIPEPPTARRLLSTRTEPQVFGKSMIVRWREKGCRFIVNTSAITKFRRTFCRALVRVADVFQVIPTRAGSEQLKSEAISGA